MARFAISGRATIAGTSLRPLVSLYATTGVRPRVYEIGLFNTTAVACVVALCRLTAAGTQGAGLTEQKESDTAQAAISTGFAGHTADLTAGQSSDNELRRASLGAAIGSGIIWTFSELGIVIPNTTADGLGVIVPSGTGQVCDYYISWGE